MPSSQDQLRNGPVAFAVVDVETTGFSAARARILEIAVVKVNAAGDVLSEYDSLINSGPYVGASDVHGITTAMVTNAPTFREASPAILEHLSGAVLVAHNAPFDLRFLTAEFGRCQQEFAPPYLCTMALRTRLGLPGRPRHKLEWACEQHGIDLTDAHCALADTRATATLLVRYLTAARAAGVTGLRGLGVNIDAAPVTPAGHLLSSPAAALPRSDEPTVTSVR